MPTASGAPRVEYGHIYSLTTPVAITIAAPDTWTDVLHASSLQTQAYKTKADNATGVVTVGKGDWEFMVRINLVGATSTDDLDCRVLVTDNDADSTTSSPHGVVKEVTSTPDGVHGHQFVIFGVAQDLQNAATIKVQVLNGTATNNISVLGFDFMVKGLKTFGYASQKTSAT